MAFLAAPGVHRIAARGFLHLSPLPEGFTARTLAIEAAGRGRRLRMRIAYTRPGGASHPVELVAFRYPAAVAVSR